MDHNNISFVLEQTDFFNNYNKSTPKFKHDYLLTAFKQ